MSRGIRDNQRSRVYAWENRASGGEDGPGHAVWESLEECEAFLKPIWRAERGRVGRAKIPMPTFSRNLWGQSRASASHGHVLKIPRWARNPWVVLHEAAHRLTPKDEAHGPRFVGVLIGLLARHDARDAVELMALADEMGVRYHVRSIGIVPVHGVRWKLQKLVGASKPLTEMELACELDVSYLQVRGAAMGLIRAGRARWLRGKLVPLGDLLPPPPPPPKKPRLATATSISARAKAIGAVIEREGRAYFVWPPKELEDDDPFEHDHFADDWGQVELIVLAYETALAAQKGTL